MTVSATSSSMLVELEQDGHPVLNLSGLIVSPYMRMIDTSVVGEHELGRDINSSPASMILKALVTGYTVVSSALNIGVELESDDTTIKSAVNLPLAYAYSDTDGTIQPNIVGTINAFCATNSLPNPAVVDWMFTTPTDLAAAILAAAPAAPVASALSLSLQTSTGAVGTQVSTTRNSYVMLNASVSTTATIGGSSAGDIILEVAPTNSATAGDWVEWGRIGNSQTISLAIALNSVQVTKGMAVAFVPAGYYVKARTAGSGTVSYSLTNAKQILN